MAIGLKLRDVRRFGQKLQRGVHTFARKVGKTADVIGAVASPIATAIAGPEGGMAVEKAIQSVKGIAGGAERLTGKGVARGEKIFKQIQAPVLGAREIVQGAKMAVKNPAQAKIMIGDVLSNRLGKQPSIQAE